MTRLQIATVFFLFLVLAGCQAKLYEYTDPKYHVSVSYPGNLDLTSDAAALTKASGIDPSQPEAIDQPQLVFILSTAKTSQLTVAVHSLPKGVKVSAEEYYQASTAKELDALGAKIVEPKTDVVINGRTFQRVGFTLQAGETPLHVRIYEYLDSKTGRILVLTPTVDQDQWDSEILELEPIINSIKIDW